MKNLTIQDADQPVTERSEQSSNRITNNNRASVTCKEEK